MCNLVRRAPKILEKVAKNPVEKILSNPVTSVAVMVFSALRSAEAPTDPKTPKSSNWPESDFKVTFPTLGKMTPQGLESDSKVSFWAWKWPKKSLLSHFWACPGWEESLSSHRQPQVLWLSGVSQILASFVSFPLKTCRSNRNCYSQHLYFSRDLFQETRRGPEIHG